MRHRTAFVCIVERLMGKKKAVKSSIWLEKPHLYIKWRQTKHLAESLNHQICHEPDYRDACPTLIWRMQDETAIIIE